ncbi:interferon-induced protein 44-like isoform X2 [Mastacembelus armatus]|uniref:interferon-induced protein 44-like isoform X2 n=1 Tax=Mastacembelus armatus TaxID=205130 RepID=UPI000E463064|nr:interferon-induced protein 44-like isoform X2 [Mastacembelus armatus]
MAAAESAGSDSLTKEVHCRRPKASKVWDYFKLPQNKKVVCTLCNASMAYHRSTTAMLAHLKRKHTDTMLEDGPPEKAKSPLSGFSFGGLSSQSLTVPTTSGQPAITTVADPKDAFGIVTTMSSTMKTNTPLFKFPVQPKLESPQSDTEISSDITFEIPVASATALEAKDGLSNVSSTEAQRDKLFTFTAVRPILESQWRDVEWTEEKKASLMKTVSSYTASCGDCPARILLLGPVGSGKSSFISSVQSVFKGRVTNRAMVGSFSTGFTKKLQSFNICDQKSEDAAGLVLCDIMGLGDGEMTGLTLHDILSVIKGHVPEGHKFSPDQPVRSETQGYVKKPSLKHKIHCVAFVVDASKILTYPKGLCATFQNLREHISDLGVHQVALLTHIEQICPETAKDVSQVYKSRIIKDMMGKAGALLGMSTSYIVPVKNYSLELDLDVNTDVLLLSAVDHILQYADLYFQDNMPKFDV